MFKCYGYTEHALKARRIIMRKGLCFSIVLLIAVLTITSFVSCKHEPDLITVTFDSNGGSGLMDPQKMNKDTANSLSPNSFAYASHIFYEWNSEKDGTGIVFKDGESVRFSEDVTLYAQWIEVTFLDPTMTTWEDGKSYSLDNDVTFENRIIIDGSVALYLPDGKTLTCNEGITVPEDSSLVIQGGRTGTGRLVSTGSHQQPGIGAFYEGGDDRSTMGTLMIFGGVIDATGGRDAAGIGGGATCYGGDVYIYGGVVNATGTHYGSGIGGGYGGWGGTLHVLGGTVTATGGNAGTYSSGGHGIGLGGGGAAGIAYLYVTGGTIYASGGNDGACGISTTVWTTPGIKLECRASETAKWHEFKPKKYSSDRYVRITSSSN